jgi:hypothetical protein
MLSMPGEFTTLTHCENSAVLTEYLVDLLNGTIPSNPIENATYQKAESFVK